MDNAEVVERASSAHQASRRRKTEPAQGCHQESVGSVAPPAMDAPGTRDHQEAAVAAVDAEAAAARRGPKGMASRGHRGARLPLWCSPALSAHLSGG